MAQEIDLASWEPEFTADPYPLVARVRKESPLCRVVVDGLPTIATGRCFRPRTSSTSGATTAAGT